MSDLQSLALVLPAETADPAMPATHSSLTLGHLLAGMGADSTPVVRLEDVLVIRHTFKPADPVALRGPEDLTEDRVLAYTRGTGHLAAPLPL